MQCDGLLRFTGWRASHRSRCKFKCRADCVRIRGGGGHFRWFLDYFASRIFSTACDVNRIFFITIVCTIMEMHPYIMDIEIVYSILPDGSQ